jgi:hypothetical protein
LLKLGLRSSGTRASPYGDRLQVASIGSGGGNPGARRFDGLHDALVARASAQVARDGNPNLVLCGRRVIPQECVRGEHDPGGAVAALETEILPECLLERMQAPSWSQAFDRCHLAAIGLDREHGARLHGSAVDEDRAGAALARVAAHVGTRETQIAPEEIHKEDARFQVPHVPDAIHGHGDRDSPERGLGRFGVRLLCSGLRGGLASGRRSITP